MEKLPEKWFIKNDNQIISDWFAKKYKCDEISSWKGLYPYIGYTGTTKGNSHNGVLGAYNKSSYPRNEEITFEQFKRLVLGETEEWEPKVGEWVCRSWKSDGHVDIFYITGFYGDKVNCDKNKYYRNGQILSGATPRTFGIHTDSRTIDRPARPEEIPQEEVEYWECIHDPWPYKILGLTCKIKNKKAETVICNVNGKYEAGTELFVSLNLKHFKPSTREAYEAQQKNKYKGEWKVECDCFDGCIKCKKVNKCSTINTNQNGTTKSKSSEVLPRKSYDFPREFISKEKKRLRGIISSCENNIKIKNIYDPKDKAHLRKESGATLAKQQLQTLNYIQ